MLESCGRSSSARYRVPSLTRTRPGMAASPPPTVPAISDQSDAQLVLCWTTIGNRKILVAQSIYSA